MHEINKTAFGEFLAERRKEEGYTQKSLAEKLFVSDKAVSKWERGLSLPDVSLLLPLSELLKVNVVELLEGRKMNRDSEMRADYVESLVKKTLTLSIEEQPERRKERQKKNAFILSGYVLGACLESAFTIWYLVKIRNNIFSTSILFLEILSLIFGVYFWLFMKERLPAYYDENRVSIYNDGMFRINALGVTFNNSNWPHIVSVLRKWSLVTMIAIPVIALALSIWNPEFWQSVVIYKVVLLLDLSGLFVPMYIVGRKYG